MNSKKYDEKLVSQECKERLELALKNMGVTEDGKLYNNIFQ